MNVEVWKSLDGYSKYKISNFGNIKSIKRNKLLKQFLNNRGYKCISLYDDKIKPHTLAIHRIVALAFIGKRPEGMVVDHIDNDKHNNKLFNLEYVTQAQNVLRGKISSLNKNKTSKYIGVSWYPRLSKWKAQFRLNGKVIHIGYFKTEEDAHLAYMKESEVL